MKPNRTGSAAVAAAATASILGVLYRFPPDRYPVYPACPFHAATGLLCPGCGATRAMSALLHGQIAQAWHLNALFVVLLPFALVYAVARLRGQRGLPRRATATGLPVLAAVTLLFTLWRNVAAQ